MHMVKRLLLRMLRGNIIGRYDMKLRIRRNPFGNKLGWLCSDGLYAYWGETPKEAYDQYMSNR